jgi:hypothetical protein
MMRMMTARNEVHPVRAGSNIHVVTFLSSSQDVQGGDECLCRRTAWTSFLGRGDGRARLANKNAGPSWRRWSDLPTEEDEHVDGEESVVRGEEKEWDEDHLARRGPNGQLKSWSKKAGGCKTEE